MDEISPTINGEISPTVFSEITNHPLQLTNQQPTEPNDNPTERENENHSSVNLTKIERDEIIQIMLMNLNKNGRPIRGILKTIGQKFNVTRNTLSIMWKRASDQLQKGETINVDSQMKGKSGRKRIDRDLSRLTNIPLNRRTSIRSLACAMELSKSTTHRMVKEGLIRPHSNAIKPQLTEANKKRRVSFCLSQLQPNNTTSNPSFQDMNNMVHIDEKWFNMTKVNQRYYLHRNEEGPYRTCKSKGYIGKVMFMCYVARPNVVLDDVPFDGKIGIFPFVTMEPAVRSSKNRPKGTLEVKPIGSITKGVIRDCMINQVLPAIQSKWPSNRSKLIHIQQDNAKPHINPEDPEFLQASQIDGFDIRLTYQPPNSPDLNVLDLGWFKAIQTIQHELAPRTIQELVDCVVKAFNQMQPDSLNYVWLSLQCVMNEVLKCNGSNNYQVPHMGKRRLDLQGLLPIVITVDPATVQQAIHFINCSTSTEEGETQNESRHSQSLQN